MLIHPPCMTPDTNCFIGDSQMVRVVDGHNRNHVIVAAGIATTGARTMGLMTVNTGKTDMYLAAQVDLVVQSIRIMMAFLAQFRGGSQCLRIPGNSIFPGNLRTVSIYPRRMANITGYPFPVLFRDERIPLRDADFNLVWKFA